MSRDLFRLVDEPTLIEGNECCFCVNAHGPFLELPLPANVIDRLGTIGALYACPDCCESMAAVFGVVSTQRLDAVVERAQEAEAKVEAQFARAKQDAATVAKLERELAKAQTEAQVANEREAIANRQIADLKASPAVLERELLLKRIEAATVERESRGRKKAPA